MKKKSKIILGVCIVAAVLIGISIWNAWFSATKIAFVNFQTIQQGSISKYFRDRQKGLSVSRRL